MSEALLNLTITPFGADQPVKFETFDDALAWLRGQREKWQRFHQYIHGHRFVSEHRDAISSAIDEISQAAEENSQDQAISILHKLELPPFLDADGAAAKLIDDALEASDSQNAFLIYMLWTDRGERQKLAGLNIDVVRLLKVTAIWSDKGGYLRIGAAARQAELETSLRILLAQSKTQLEFLNSEYQKQLANLHSTHEEKLADLHRTQSSALDQLNKTYLEHLRLKAPADYWSQKAEKHTASAALWLKWLMGFIGAGLIGSAAFLYKNFYSLIDHVSGKESGTTAIVLLALPALLYLTLVRVAHKSYRDEVRHAVDAEQRSTLVQTYLALNNENDGKIEPGERLLALHALFRGSSMSDSPDDTPPVNSLEAILQSLKPK